MDFRSRRILSHSCRCLSTLETHQIPLLALTMCLPLPGSPVCVSDWSEGFVYVLIAQPSTSFPIMVTVSLEESPTQILITFYTTLNYIVDVLLGQTCPSIHLVSLNSWTAHDSFTVIAFVSFAQVTFALCSLYQRQHCVIYHNASIKRWLVSHKAM